MMINDGGGGVDGDCEWGEPAMVVVKMVVMVVVKMVVMVVVKMIVIVVVKMVVMVMVKMVMMVVMMIKLQYLLACASTRPSLLAAMQW